MPREQHSYPVMEVFHTVQGEGYFTGQAAVFIRLAGCDVGCVWCDVKESWDASNHPLMDVDQIIERVEAFSSSIVVITGGEPGMYDLSPLCERLHKHNRRVHLETSGAHSLRGEFDWVCFSPKKFKFPLESIYNQANELKVVVYNSSDFKWAERFAELVTPQCELYLQPEWDKKAEVMPEMVEYILSQSKWKISTQTHKYMGVP